MKYLSTIFLLLASVVSVTAQQSFTSPNGGSVTAGEQTTIRWTASDTSVSKVTINLCLYGGQVQCNPIATDVDNNGSTNWTPATDLSSTGSYFLLMLNGATQLATSNPFSVSGASGSSSSGGSSGSSSSGSSGSSASGTTGNSATGTTGSGGQVTVTVTGTGGTPSTIVTNPNGNSDDGGSNAATIGGAVGGTLGGLALLGIGGFLLFRHRKKKKAAAAEDEKGEKDLEAGAAGGKKSKEEKRSSKRKSGLLGKKGVSIPDPDAGVVEAADNPVYEMSAEPEPVEAPDHNFYAMELDSREVLPQERDAKAAAAAEQQKNLRTGDKLSPAINLSPPGADNYRYNLAKDVSDDQKSDHQYQAYKPPTDGAADTKAGEANATDVKATEAKDATEVKPSATDATKSTDASKTDETKKTDS